MITIKFINMRKVLISSALASLLLTAGTGCLKDKDFEDQKYGLQVKEVKAVTFVEAPGGPLLAGIASVTTSQTIDGPVLSLEQEGVASSDVKVTIAIDPNLATALGLTPLPTPSYSLSSLTPTIAAGTKLYDGLKITVPNASTLDASKTFGIGLRITAVDQGYIIAKNYSEIVISLNVKNAWAADYDVTGNFYHPSVPRVIDDVKTLVTISPVRSRAPHSDLYPSNYYFDFDVSATNTLVNYAPYGATPNGGFMTADNPGGAPFPLNNPPAGTAPWVSTTYNNTYNPTTKTFWMHYGYVASGSTNQNDFLRQVYEKWVRQ
jgi:Domain of unknown function (DUF1735)